MGGIFIMVSSTFINAGLLESYGLGPSAIGKAEAVIATVNDWTAPYYNVAGLSYPTHHKITTTFTKKNKKKGKSFQPKIDDPTGLDIGSFEVGFTDSSKEVELNTFEFGFAYLHQISFPNITINSNGNLPISPNTANNIGIASQRINYGVIQLGINYNLASIIPMPYNVPFNLGLSLALRDDATLLALNDTSIEDYNFLKLGREPQIITVIMGLSGQIWKDRLSIGLGGSLAIGGKGEFKITDINVAPNTSITPRHDFQVDINPTIAPVAGITYNQPIYNRPDELHIAVSFRGEAQLKLSPLDAYAEVDLLLINLPLNLSILDFYTPHTILFGANYKTYLSPMDISVSIDGEYQFWSNFQISPSKQDYYKKIALEIPKMKDAFIAKIGIEIQPKNQPFTFSLGYAYHQSFVGNHNNYKSNFLDNDKHIVSLGASYYVFPKFLLIPLKTKFDLGVQYQYWSNKTVSRSETSVQEDINGSPQTVNSTPSYTYKAQLLVFTLGASLLF